NAVNDSSDQLPCTERISRASVRRHVFNPPVYELDGNESPRELETLFEAMKFLMSFSFTAAEELREVAEREAVQMAEKEEAWEEQKIALKARSQRLASYHYSSEAFRAQINSLREENRELEKANRDRDREMADLRDRFESLVTRADVLTRERDALEQHRNQMEDTIRELQRRISAKSEESTNEWESRRLRQRNEQAVTLTRQMQAVVLQNEELREEISRVSDALEEATKVINDSAVRYAELNTQHETVRRSLSAMNEENELMRKKLEASTSMLAALENEAMGNEQSTAAELREMNDVNYELRKELYATKRELESLRQIADLMNNKDKEAELDKLRMELIEATKTAQSLCGQLTSKSSTDPTVALRLKIMQLETNLKQETEKLTTQMKTLEDLENALVSKDEVNRELAAEIDRLKELKFGSAREELQRLTTQLSFRDAQIAKLTNHCTMLQIELGNYAERGLRPPPITAQCNAYETQTENGDKSDVIPQNVQKHAGSEKRKRRKPLRQREEEHVTMDFVRPKEDRESTEDVWKEQAVLIVSLYSEMMIIMEEQELKEKQIMDMELVLSNGRRAVDDMKSQLKKAYEEIYSMRMSEISTTQKNDIDAVSLEVIELRSLTFEYGSETSLQPSRARYASCTRTNGGHRDASR
uniref:Shootin-1 n=1 Tax=Angiostrongylus cantonensis TaxID=6313 RepID=A0A158PBH5_ANGCA